MAAYTSTRADCRIAFADAVAMGLAPGGGLTMPREWPQLGRADLARIADTDYGDALAMIGAPFAGDGVTRAAWRRIGEAAAAGFRHPAVAPLSQIDRRGWLLELFHGPSLSFKDYGLQPLARLLGELRGDADDPLFVLGATSGDTGSAGIAAFAEAPGVRGAILHPAGRISEVQRRQMTAAGADNFVNIAVEGSFDDCQRLVKSLLGERAREAASVLSINSINWARLVFQAVYYARTAARLARLNRRIAFVVPSGNFGNALAAILAAKLGARIERLVVASNANDFLTRILTTGTAEVATAQPTLSPAMDIQIPSNLERLVYLAAGEDPEATAAIMARAESEGRLRLPEGWRAKLPVAVEAVRVDDTATRETIQAIYAATDRILDPHTAVAAAAAEATPSLANLETAIVATAHPAKFPEAVESALGFAPPVPAPLAEVFAREERFVTCPASLEALRGALPA